MAQAKWNVALLAADPTENVQSNDLYINDGTLTPTGKPAFRWRDGNASAWDDVNPPITPVAAVSGDGSLTIPNHNTDYYITKGSVASMFIADPTPTTHDGLHLTFLSTTAFAHTLNNGDGKGFNNGGAGSDVATWGGAIADGFAITGYQGTWYVLPGQNNNVTLG